MSNKNLSLRERKTKQSFPDVNTRMNYLIGHLQANLKMIDEGRYCIDIIRQNQAVISALEKVNELLLKNHLATCVTRAVEGKDKRQKEKVFEEIVEVFNEK